MTWNSEQNKRPHGKITYFSGHSILNWVELSLETVFFILQVNFQAPGLEDRCYLLFYGKTELVGLSVAVIKIQ